MELLLCSATEMEIKSSLDHIRSKKNKKININVLITGVGITTACFQLSKYIFIKRPDLVLQAGICGALDTNLPLNTAVVVKSEMIADEGVEEGGEFHSVFDLGLREPNQFPWKNKRLYNNGSFADFKHLPIVDGITVNEITTRPERLELYKKKYGASIESMEGAVLHYICLMEQISFVQLRTISNYAGERDKKKWRIDTAIQELNFEVEKIINKLSDT